MSSTSGAGGRRSRSRHRRYEMIQENRKLMVLCIQRHTLTDMWMLQSCILYRDLRSFRCIRTKEDGKECGIVLKGLSNMVRHIFNDHVKYYDQRFSCATCEVGFGDLSYLKDHLKEDRHIDLMKECESSDSEISREPNPNATKLHLGTDYVKVEISAGATSASKRDRSVSPTRARKVLIQEPTSSKGDEYRKKGFTVVPKEKSYSDLMSDEIDDARNVISRMRRSNNRNATPETLMEMNNELMDLVEKRQIPVLVEQKSLLALRSLRIAKV